jgi:hypothetical protein
MADCMRRLSWRHIVQRRRFSHGSQVGKFALSTLPSETYIRKYPAVRRIYLESTKERTATSVAATLIQRSSRSPPTATRSWPRWLQLSLASARLAKELRARFPDHRSESAHQLYH